MIFDNPYNHLIKDNFLNTETCKYLKNKDLKQMADTSNNVLNNPNASKKRLITKVIIKNEVNSKLDDKHKGFYKSLFIDLKKQFDDNFFKSLTLDQKLQSEGTYNILHTWDEPGFFMKPHVDTERKIWTGIIYLFGDGKSRDGSTTLFGGNETNNKDIIPSYNRFLAFKRSSLAKHAVRENLSPREILLINFNRIEG